MTRETVTSENRAEFIQKKMDKKITGFSNEN